MYKVAIIGAAGRMGQRLIVNVNEASDMQLSGALEASACPRLGEDAGVVAGCGALGVKLTDNCNEALKDADAVINFSIANVIETTQVAIANNAVVVIGTTALSTEDKEKLAQLAQNGGRIVFAANMSVGVNLLFYLSSVVAKVLDDNYDIEVVEMHHNQKKDSPSGTAVRLAEVLCEARELNYDSDIRHGREGMVGERTKKEIGMHALRGGDVVGDHTVMFAANGERIELTHKASSRDTFAAGAVRAVRFLLTAEAGLYDMQDVLNLK